MAAAGIAWRRPFGLQGYSPVYSVILHLVEVSVNSTVILRGGTGIARGALLGVSARLLALLLGSLLVNLLADGVESLLQVVLLCLDGLNIGTLQGFLQGVQLGLDRKSVV